MSTLCKSAGRSFRIHCYSEFAQPLGVFKQFLPGYVPPAKCFYESVCHFQRPYGGDVCFGALRDKIQDRDCIRSLGLFEAPRYGD